ncbi:MAG: hypothetical protein IPP77_12555 [Bacteroidetes bacterium]|nr:hypothetical protein [Bacteroidota bacterium]
MKKEFFKTALWAVLILVSVASQAREEFNKPKKTNSRSTFKTEAGDCTASIAQFDMDINNVRTRLLTGGDAWWDVSSLPKYEVPKGSDLHAIFAGSIWITGLDDGNNLKCAAVRYRQNGNDFWPGPLDNSASTDRATCSRFDRHFNVYGRDIAAAQTAFLQKGSATTLADIPRGLLGWPAKGNQYLATDPTLVGQTFNINENLAPFKDADGDGIYDPVKGDYPVIPCPSGDPIAYGDQMVFWVFNDAGNIHTESNGQAIGVQVNALAFGFQTTDEIDNMTFYKYEITNKSTNKLNQTYISQWVDPDLGCFNNDKIGCDTVRSLGICYNGTTPDPDCQQENGYGTQLPIVGFDFFEGPISDSGQQLGLSSFVYFTNGAVFSQQDPGSAAQYRNYQTGFWNDGTPFTTGGTGYNSGGAPTKFLFPGNPSDPDSWSECQKAVSEILQPADRRFVQTSGPFTLLPGVPQSVTVGCVFVRPSGQGVGLCPNFSTTIAPADDKAQQLFNTCFKLLDGPEAPSLKIRELSNEVIINLVNFPGSNNFGEKYDEVDGATAQSVSQLPGGKGDSTFTFEGYKVYQLSRRDVSATDLNDPDKAKLYAQVDVKNGISKIINFKKDATLGLFIPVLEVDGTDAGVENSFRVTQDLFATGNNKQLVNHKTYYYTAVAYAYNNYKQFEQGNPSDGGQLLPYLQGRGNFKVYTAIPHIPDPRNEGTILNSVWGDGVEVKRIEGQGNGGSNLMLTPESIAKILASGTYGIADTLVYQKGLDPIGLRVTDPVSLLEADFELNFKDTVTNNIGITTSWFLHDLTNGDTIFSERTLDRPYEQQIILTKNGNRLDYGFSIKLGTPAKRYTILANYPVQGLPQRAVYDPLPEQSSITYQIPTQQWLSFLEDEGVNSPSNWIRSGSNAAGQQQPGGGGANPLAGVYDANWYFTGPVPPSDPAEGDNIYTDTNNIFSKILNGTWAPYCLAANYANKSTTASIPYAYGPGFKWRNYGGYPIPPPHNTLDKLASVDIVITPDRSKWSRCVVFETGEDESINQGNEIYNRTISNSQVQNRGALKGQIRMAYSKVLDANGNLVGVDPYGPDADTGRSYFPGYAINVETGERLNMAFGESSDQGDQNGRDMFWNPSPNLYSPLFQPYFGGKHFIYVMDTRYDEGYAAQQLLLRTYDSIITQQLVIPRTLYPLYQSLMWTSIPYLSAGYNFLPDGNGQKYIPPTEIAVRLRVEKPYDRFATSASSGMDSTLPRYQFSTKGIGATEKNPEMAKSALDIIRVVPNPYLAYSDYETDQNTNAVKITNLPNVCNITIFSIDGVIIRKLSRAIGVDPITNRKVEISDGGTVSGGNIDNTITWDLKNDKGVPIASGIYLVHVEAPGIGQRTLKWFGAVRPADTTNF